MSEHIVKVIILTLVMWPRIVHCSVLVHAHTS